MTNPLRTLKEKKVDNFQKYKHTFRNYKESKCQGKM